MPIFNPPVSGASASAGTGDFSRGAQVFKGQGTYTFTVPSGVTEVFVNLFGGGGRGNYNSSYWATGGGGGGYAGGILTVVPGTTYTVTCGTGGWLNGASTTVTDGTDSTFKSGGTTLLTAGGGKGGLQTSSFGSSQELLGGLGGVGTVNSAVSFIASYTASGGRGGNLKQTSSSSTPRRCTGGGASGSLTGDGGRGGDHFMNDTGSSAYVGTGGGGWSNGNGGDHITSSVGGYVGTGGGGFMHPGGGGVTVQGTWFGSPGSSWGSGMLYTSSASPLSMQINTNTTYWSNDNANINSTDGSRLGKTSWWSYMTGEALVGKPPSNRWQHSGDGCGSWGWWSNSIDPQYMSFSPGFGGGHGGFSRIVTSPNDDNIPGDTRRERFGGGGGGKNSVTSQIAAMMNSAIVDSSSWAKTLGHLARAPYGGGSGGCNSSIGATLGGGDGFCVICYK